MTDEENSDPLHPPEQETDALETDLLEADEPTMVQPMPPPLEPAAQPPAPAALPQGMPFDGWVKPLRPQHPRVGATLWCFGALFWAYLVAGEIVVWTAVPEAFGVLAVLIAFGLAWHRATSQIPQAPRWGWLLPGIIAFFSWLLVLLMSSVIFSTGGRKEAELAALFLWSVAAGSYAVGRHLTAQRHVALTSNARAGRIALWVIAGIATLIAGVNVVNYA